MLRGNLVALLATLLLVQTCGADVVVLKDQRQVRGTLADRDAFARNPGRTAVALLPADSTALRRFAHAEISHVILEDGGSTRVFDLEQPASRPAQPVPANRLSSVDSYAPGPLSLRSGALVLSALGASALIVGFAVKFGTEKSLFSDGKPVYNGANYACMGAGGAMLMGGITLLGVSQSQPVVLAPSAPELRAAVAVHF